MKRNRFVMQSAQSLGIKDLSDFQSMRPFLNSKGVPCVFKYVGPPNGNRKDQKNYAAFPVNNAALQYEEWRTLDEAVGMVAEERLVGFDDLRSRGLVYNLNNPMSTTVLSWEEMSDALEAVVSIDPVRRGDNDVVDFKKKDIPIPVTHADFQLSERLLQESRVRGNGLDTNNAERAARSVSVKLEDMLFGTAPTMVYGGGTIHSYISFPDKNTVSANDWLGSGKTPEGIVDDIIAAKQASISNFRYGPWMVYIPTRYETLLDKDYSITNSSNRTIRQRILDIEGILDIKTVDRMQDDRVLLIQMTRDCVDLIDGMPMQTVQWNGEGGFMNYYKVLAIQIPRIKSDYNGNSGVTVLEMS